MHGLNHVHGVEVRPQRRPQKEFGDEADLWLVALRQEPQGVTVPGPRLRQELRELAVGFRHDDLPERENGRQPVQYNTAASLRHSEVISKCTYRMRVWRQGEPSRV